MYKYTFATHIISMEVLNFEIINSNWIFKYFVLDSFHNNILAVLHNKHITSTKFNSFCPTYIWNIERMFRRCYYFVFAYKYVNKFRSLVYKCLGNIF